MTNASLPKGVNPDEVTFEQAEELLAARAALGPPKKKAGRGAPKRAAKPAKAPAAAKKKPAAKAAKGPAAKKPSKKKAPLKKPAKVGAEQLDAAAPF